MRDLFGSQRALVGVVHLAAMPGTPTNTLAPRAIIEQAVAEAATLAESGFDAIILENMHDRPYMNGQVGPEVVAVMSIVCAEVRRLTGVPIGVQILAGANEQAMAAAFAGGADFIRAEGFVFGHLADEGAIEACAGPLLRYRKTIGATQVRILCDIKKKHSSHAVTADLSLADTAKAAEFFLADGLVVTGLETGHPTDPMEVQEAAQACSLPVWVGSGINLENIGRYSHAHGLIVGSWIKQDGDWRKPVDSDRATRLVSAFRAKS